MLIFIKENQVVPTKDRFRRHCINIRSCGEKNKFFYSSEFLARPPVMQKRLKKKFINMYKSLIDGNEFGKRVTLKEMAYNSSFYSSFI
jgi:hypothetical protein